MIEDEIDCKISCKIWICDWFVGVQEISLETKSIAKFEFAIDLWPNILRFKKYDWRWNRSQNLNLSLILWLIFWDARNIIGDETVTKFEFATEYFEILVICDWIYNRKIGCKLLIPLNP